MRRGVPLLFFDKMMNDMMNSANSLQKSGGSNQHQSQQQNLMSMMMGEEKEWECWCGHKFRAPGLWVPCAPITCMAPRCPNPKFFMEGPGREMLKVKGGTPLPSKPVGALDGRSSNGVIHLP
eukprot:PhF_6_TR38357/c0_g1_i1/m.57172